MLVLAGCKKEVITTQVYQRYLVFYNLRDSTTYARAAFNVNSRVGQPMDSNAIVVTANGLERDSKLGYDEPYRYQWAFDKLTDIEFGLRVQGRTTHVVAQMQDLGAFTLSMDTLVTNADTIMLHWDGDAVPEGAYMYAEIAYADGKRLPGDRYEERITGKDQPFNFEKTRALAPGRYIMYVAREWWDKPLDAYESEKNGSMSYVVNTYMYFTVE